MESEHQTIKNSPKVSGELNKNTTEDSKDKLKELNYFIKKFEFA
jgi:hypothetical protein